MADNFHRLAFTPGVRAAQVRSHGRAQPVASGAPAGVDVIGDAERAFVESRDSFYMASVTETGWPYVQHRGGPAGFLHVIDEHTLGFADLRGNRQLISTGNLASDDRVALMLMDYPNQRRLKVLGRVRIVDAHDDPQLAAGFTAHGVVERVMLIRVEGLDWNCPQHITPRYTEAEFAVRRRQDAGDAARARSSRRDS